jgi:hypothetical protein
MKAVHEVEDASPWIAIHRTPQFADQPVFRSLTGVTPGEYAAEVGQRGQAGPSGNTAT